MDVIFQQCEAMIRKGSSSFYHAFRGLPSPRREAVYVIYAFCRLIDDSVDEPENSPYSIFELRSHFSELERAEGHFIWPALRWLFETFPQLDQGPFLRQIEGQLSDLIVTRYTTMMELENYCYLVAGTVGEMLLPVLRDDRDASCTAAGIALGKGMQLVNIMRDVGEDKRRGRRYIPMELMARHGYSEEDYSGERVNPAFISMMNELKDRAMVFLRLGLTFLETYPPASGLAVELAAVFYYSIIQSIEENGFDVFGQRAYVSDEQKLRLYVSVASRYAAIGNTGKAAASL
ncbi:phytoene/squalene synthase family protein [Paenibacillus chibensis]|uniref:Phytoene/squalene synthase family protein n=1 Tax=Paenibacillus chibensis TaxID=59846 RepID=A0ABU6Q118_9BACL|nr:phytoene/squalene synthase family protein [Paenibacillus chibensis]